MPKKTEYALIALHSLLEGRGEPTSAREIAERFNLPCALLMNVMKDLQQAGIVTSTRGAKGGYRLAVEPAETSLYDVLVATSGDVALTECCGGAGQHTCEAARRTVTEASSAGTVELKISGCPIREPLKVIHHRLVRFLKEIPLSELLGGATSRMRAANGSFNGSLMVLGQLA